MYAIRSTVSCMLCTLHASKLDKTNMSMSLLADENPLFFAMCIRVAMQQFAAHWVNNFDATSCF